eukprot:6371594-Pyramimonas_sp.AAC.1
MMWAVSIPASFCFVLTYFRYGHDRGYVYWKAYTLALGLLAVGSVAAEIVRRPAAPGEDDGGWLVTAHALAYYVMHGALALLTAVARPEHDMCRCRREGASRADTEERENEGGGYRPPPLICGGGGATPSWAGFEFVADAGETRETPLETPLQTPSLAGLIAAYGTEGLSLGRTVPADTFVEIRSSGGEIVVDTSESRSS